MAPPELAADAPVLDIVHPLVVGIDPVFGHELHRAALHRVNGFLGDGSARWVRVADFVHRDKPLVGQHGLHDLPGAGANRQHHFVRLDLQHQAQDFQVTVDGLARGKTIHALVGRRPVLVDLGVQREDGDQRQTVALRAGVVVEVVRAGDLDATRAKGAVHKVVGNDRNFPVAQGQIDHFPQQMDIAFVLRMHRQCTVGHHGLRPGGSNRHALLQHAVDPLRPV